MRLAFRIVKEHTAFNPRHAPPWRRLTAVMPRNRQVALALRGRAAGRTRLTRPRTPPVVELDGIEPTASCLQSRRSPN
jgi:hypothetical protein